MSRKEISQITVKKLFALSGNICAFSSCNSPLVRDGNIVCEICHIEGYSPKGPRYNPNSTDIERNKFENLMLFCCNCHKVVDSDQLKYNVAYLMELKKNHEQHYAFNQYNASDQNISELIATFETSMREALTSSLQERDAKRLSTEYETIVSFIEYLSNSSVDEDSIPLETEPDPENKIMNRFKEHSTDIINALIDLIPLYQELRIEVEKTIGLSSKQIKLMIIKLKNDSKIALQKNNNNPILAINDMQKAITEKIEFKGISHDEGAIRYCLYYRMIQCFIFPNE